MKILKVSWAICAFSLGIRERVVRRHMIALAKSDPPARTPKDIHLITCPETTAEIADSWSDRKPSPRI